MCAQETNETSSDALPNDPDAVQRRLAFTNTLLFETPGGLRFTQDSPILPNVWLAYAHEPRSQQELILTVSRDSATGLAAMKIREMLNELRASNKDVGQKAAVDRLRPRVSYIPGQIAVKLYFDEMMRIVLPLTPWWHETYRSLRRIQFRHEEKSKPANWYDFPKPDAKREQDLLDALMLMRREIDRSANTAGGSANGNGSGKSEDRMKYIRDIPSDLSWMVRIAGLLGNCFHNGHDLLGPDDELGQSLNRDFKARQHDRIETTAEREARVDANSVPQNEARATREEIVGAFVKLYKGWCEKEDYPSEGAIWRVTKNRRVHLAVANSTLTVKADAAKTLFNISCRGQTWAVVDSGIDSTHPAFKQTDPEHEREVRKTLAEDARKKASSRGKKVAAKTKGIELAKALPIDKLKSRVVKTLDFTRLRELLDYDINGASRSKAAKALRKNAIQEIARRNTRDKGNYGEADLKDAKERLDELRKRMKDGKEIGWQDLQFAIEDKNPEAPTNDHGTHVAGILGADWIEDEPHERELPLAQRTRRMRGVCPDINLIDVRVFREDGLTDEFELLAAMQYLRWMNARAGTMQVHGANLSLSLIHEVRRFACGQTPICDECNDAAALGIVVVAAAGNRGFDQADMEEIRASDTYKTVSITDPGNAANVITVGSTHGRRPHEYGVSYFSSRGPTGDGRLKPDIVAPGEKIKGPTPQGREDTKDGTSMAAPHVSGIAAMLMSRHSELIGQPQRIKDILCNTATDLGRERYFQGNGLVDALRALQSI